MVLEGTVRNGVIVLDRGAQLPEGMRVAVELEENDGSASVPGVDPALRQRFQELVCQWKEAMQYVSSGTEMVTHPAYQRIIGLGRPALPLLLEELRREPDHWFWALRAITGENPVAEADAGKLEPMTAAWLRWAHEHGY